MRRDLRRAITPARRTAVVAALTTRAVAALNRAGAVAAPSQKLGTADFYDFCFQARRAAQIPPICKWHDSQTWP